MTWFGAGYALHFMYSHTESHHFTSLSQESLLMAYIEASKSPIAYEKRYGRLMLELAVAEGHAPKHLIEQEPRNVRQSDKRKDLRNFLIGSTESYKTTDLAKKINMSDDSVRRFCSQFIKEGWLRSTKDQNNGFRYSVIRH